jgi:queuine tRNA-ribosyltransferase
MAFDECPRLPADNHTLRQSLSRTLRWAKECRNFPLGHHQKLFGIIQGGLSTDLRKESLATLLSLGMDGLAIGGLSVGEKNSDMWKFLSEFTPFLPENLPRYLMGVGTPLDLIKGVALGIDMFDCVLPTRNARNGQAITSVGPINLKNAGFKDKDLPLDLNCDCKICRRYNVSYLRHLVNVGEYLGGHALTYHNIYFYLNLMKRIRSAIKNQEFTSFYRSFCATYTGGEDVNGS